MGGQEKHVIKAAQTVEELNPLDAANAEAAAASAAAPEPEPQPQPEPEPEPCAEDEADDVEAS